MEPDLVLGEREFYVVATEQPVRLVVPFEGMPYPCLLWAEKSTSRHFKADIAKYLIDTDCRYVVCGGLESFEWEAAVDLAYTDPMHNSPSSRDVMTTSHGDDAEDASWFFSMCTNFNEHWFSKYLILIIGSDKSIGSDLLNRIKAHDHV